MDAELERRLGWSARKIDLPAGRYDTVLPPTAVSDLMIYAYWVASARTAYDGQSVYARPGGGTRIGDRLAAARCRSTATRSTRRCGRSRSWSPPPAARTPASSTTVSRCRAPTGSATGCSSRLVQTRETAALTGQPVTPVVDNLLVDVEGRPRQPEDLVRDVDRGLLLTCLWYIREVDPQTLLLTGLTRDGVYLVEGGEIVGAVNNFRFNESPIDLLDRFCGRVGDGAVVLPRVGRLLPADRHPRPPRPRLQHVHRLPGPVAPPVETSPRAGSRRHRCSVEGSRAQGRDVAEVSAPASLTRVEPSVPDFSTQAAGRLNRVLAWRLNQGVGGRRGWGRRGRTGRGCRRRWSTRGG